MTGTERIPVFRTTRDAYRTVFGNLGALARIGWLPFVLVIGITVLAGQVPEALYDGSLESFLSRAIGFVFWPIVNLTCLFLFACFVAQWHRHVLLGGAAQGEGSGLRYLRRNAMFFAAAICVDFAFGAPRWLYMTVFELPLDSWILPFLLLYVPMAVLLLVYVRISPLFPDIALNARLNCKLAWAASKGEVWRIALVIVYCAAPFMIAYFMFGIFVARNLRLARYEAVLPYLKLSSWFTEFLVGALVASALSLIYKSLLGVHRITDGAVSSARA